MERLWAIRLMSLDPGPCLMVSQSGIVKGRRMDLQVRLLVEDFEFYWELSQIGLCPIFLGR
jgi:hypothetical protein